MFQFPKNRFIGHVASTFGFSVALQLIGWLRHAMIAAYFGLSRDLDSYWVVYALVGLSVFNLAAVFDTVAVSRLVQVRESAGEEAFWRASNRLLMQAIGAAALIGAATLALLWITLPILAAGFDAAERDFVLELGWYFFPWMVVVVPYYALSAHLKATWQFHWVFGAEIVVMVASIAVLVFDHQHVAAIPIAYAVGYGAALLLLAARRGIRRSTAALPERGIASSMTRQYLAMQVSNGAGLAERFFQSFLMSGGISALSYSGLIVNSISSFLTFREIYVVPLAVEEGRENRLERMLQGVMVISIPSACFIAAYALPVITVLLQRGNFDAEAAAVTAAVLRIQALTLVLSTLIVPLERMFQILDRVSLTHIRNVAMVVSLVAFQSLFVLALRMDVQGVAWAWLCNSTVLLVVVAILVRRCGIIIRWRTLATEGLAIAAISIVAVAVSLVASRGFSSFSALVVGGGVYWAIVATIVFLMRHRLRLIIG